MPVRTTTSSDTARSRPQWVRSGCASVAFVVALAGASSPHVARADVPSAADLESARALFKQGMEARARGDRKLALEKLRAANAYGQTPITGLEFGRSLVEDGQFVEARETFLAVVRSKVQSDESERSAAARREAATLAESVQAKISGIVVKLAPLPPEAKVEVVIDGASVPAAALDAERRVNPGSHVVTARAGEGPLETVTVSLEPGEVKVAQLAPKWVGPKGPPHEMSPLTTKSSPPAPQGEGRGLSPLFWVGVGGTVLFAAAGTATGIGALNKASIVKSACPIPSACTPAVEADYRTGRTLALVSTIGFAVAGGFATLGIVGLAMGGPKTEEPKSGFVAKPYVGAGSAGITGSF